MFIATYLKSTLLNQFGFFSKEEKLQISNSPVLFNFTKESFLVAFFNECRNLQGFVVSGMAIGFSTLIRLGWFEDDAFQTIFSDLGPLLSVKYFSNLFIF